MFHPNCLRSYMNTNFPFIQRASALELAAPYGLTLCFPNTQSKVSQKQNNFIFKCVDKATSFDLQSHHQAILNHTSIMWQCTSWGSQNVYIDKNCWYKSNSCKRPTIFINVYILGSKRCALPLNKPIIIWFKMA